MKNVLLLLKRSTDSYLLPWFIGVVMALMTINVQAAELKLEQSVEGNVATVLAGQSFTYVLNYRCASLTENCENVKLISNLPPEVVALAEEISPTTEAHNHIESFNITDNVVTWEFVNPLDAGTTGELKLTVRLRNGQTPDDTVITNEASLEGSNADTANSEPASVTVTAESVVTLTKELLTVDPKLGSEAKYQITLCNELGEGRLDLLNVEITDPLLPNTEFVSAETGGTYDADSHAVTWPLIQNLAIGDCFESRMKVKYPVEHFEPGVIINEVVVTGTPVGDVEKTYTASAPAQFREGATGGYAALDITKIGTSTVIQEGSIDYGFSVKNIGNVDLENVILTDKIPSQLVVTSLRAGDNNQPDGSITVKIEYKTNNIQTWTPVNTFATPPMQTVTVSSLGLANGEYITDLRWIFETLPVGFRSEGRRTTFDGFSVDVLPIDRNGQPVEVGDIIENYATYDFTYEGVSRHKDTNEETEVIYAMAAPRLQKTVSGISTITPGGTATYQLELTNMKVTTMDNPSVIDILDENLEYAGEWRIVSKPNDAPLPVFELVDNFNGSGKTALIWDWPNYSLERWKDLIVEFKVKVKQTTPPGAVPNRAYVFAENPSNAITVSSCLDKIADSYDVDVDGDTDELVCASEEAIITASTLASMESLKWVKGMLDPDYHRYPNTGKTSRGGWLDYRLIVKNVGNVSMTNVVVIDILPFVNDTGVIDPALRESEWQPQLRGAVQASGIIVSYSTEENPCRTEVLPNNPPGCKDPAWTVVLPEDISTVRSLRFDFGDKVVEPGDELKLEWPMYAPLDAPIGTIAWNSFGYVARQLKTGEQLLPSEPVKVGIEVDDFKPAVLGDYVWLDNNGNGLQDEDATAGVNGVRVELYQPGADGQANTNDDIFLNYLLTDDDENGNPGYYIFSSLPAGDYFVKFFPPIGYKISPQDQDNGEADADAKDSDVDPETHVTQVVSLTADQHDYRWDMGLIEKGTAALGNYVWFDRNQDGVQNESASSGINDLQVTLYQDNGNGEANLAEDDAIATTRTTNNVDGYPGYYMFEDIDPGQYFVMFELPDGAWFSGRDLATSDAEDSDPNPATGLTKLISLSTGDVDKTWDAGIVLPKGDLSLGNRVWLDIDENSVYDAASEKGINDVLVNLYRDTDGNGKYTPDVDIQAASMRTYTKNEVKGFYLFEELLEGDYIVQIDASNFAMGGINPLNGLISSKGGPDPDPALDHDDNGIPMEGHGVVSLAVTLTEPEDLSDLEALRNLTVDFGFHERNTTCADPTFYALHDNEVSDTQFFTVNPRTMAVAALGDLHVGYDIEGLDMNPDTNELYATSGDDTGCIDPSANPKTCEKHPIGHLYKVNSSNGTLEPIGSTGFGEVSAISFNPKTGVLWAWADRQGLLTININDGVGTLVIPQDAAVEALTWGNKGEILYAAADRELWSASDWVVDPNSGKPIPNNVGMICPNLPGQVEALEMADNNILLFALHQGNDLNIYGGTIAGLACPELEHIEINTSYYDIEAITWRIGCDIEEELAQSQ